jgi:hypothetical protein
VLGLVPVAHGLPVEVVEEFAGLDLEAGGDAKDGGQPWFAGAAFEPADHRAVNVCGTGERVLGQAALVAELADATAERCAGGARIVSRLTH